MQIRTLFHNANFLKKSTPNADARAALKAGRRLVCVLFMLVMCASAVWGAQFRLKNASATGEQSWDSSSTWQDSSLGISWGNADNPPTSSDRVYLQGAAGVETVIRLTSSITVNQLIINSGNISGGTIRFVADHGVTITVNDKLCLGLPDNGGTVNLILDNVSLSCLSLEVNDDVNNHHKNDGNLVISGTGTAQITADTVNVFADKANSPGAMSIDFGNVPLSATNVNINSDDKTGGVTIETDSIIDAGTVTIGGSNAGNTNTTFGGTGSIDVDTWGGNSASANVSIGSNLAVLNSPTDPDSYTITVGSFDNFATSEANNSVSLTITVVKENSLPDGTPLNVPFTLTQTRDDLFSLDHQTLSGTPPGANLIFWNPDNKTYTRNDITLACYSWNTLQDGDGFTLKIYSTQNVLLKTIEWHYEDPDAYSFTATGVDTFTGNGDQIDVTITSAVANREITYTFERSATSTGDAKFTLNGYSDINGHGTFGDPPQDKNWPIKAVQPLEEGDGFTLTVYRPSGSVLGTVTWTKPCAKWTGAVSSDWNTLGNWSGITSLTELETKDVTIDSSYTRAPEISSTATVKSLTIADGKQVTLSGGTLTTESLTCAGGTFYQTGGTLTAGSIACTGAGVFTASAGEVIFNGADGALTLSSDSYLYNASIASGKKLTLSSALTFKGSLDVSAGTLVTNGKTVIFSGTGTEAIPLTITTGSNTLDKLDVTSGFLALSGDLTAGTVTNVSFTNVNIGATSVLTLNGNLTVTGTLDNRKKIEVGAYTLSFGKYTHTSAVDDTITINDGTVIATGTGTDELISNVTLNGNATFTNNGSGNLKLASATVAADAELTVGGTGNAPVFTNLSVDSGKTLTLGSALSVTSTLTNAGTINTNGKNLSFATISDTGTIQLAADGTLAVLSGGSGGTINRLQFTVNRSFSNITGLAFKDCIIDAEVELKAVSTGLTFSGSITNNGSLNVDSKTVECASYTGSGSDKILANNGTFKCGGGTINEAQLGGNTAVYNTGSGALVFTTVLVSADNSKLKASNGSTGTLTLGTTNITGNATLTSEATNSASVPGFTTVNVNSGKTLTLGSNLTLGTLDNRGTVNAAGYALSFATYTNGAGTQTDAVTVNGGSITATGTGGTISSATLNGTSSVTNSGTGTLMLTAASVTSNNAVLTVAKSGSATLPELIDVSVTSSTAKLTLNSSLTVSGRLTNNGTVSFSGKTLTAGTFEGNGGYTVSGAVTLSSGTSTTPGTVASVTTNGTTTFTQTGSYTLTSFTVSSGNTMSLGSDLTVTDTLENQGSIDVASGKTVSFAKYTNTAYPKNDSITVNNGYIVSTGIGTGNSNAIKKITMNGDATITRSGMGALKVTAVSVDADATLTVAMAGSATGLPEIAGVTVASNKTLTLGSDLSVTGTLTNNGTVSVGTQTLTFGSYSHSGSGDSLAVAGGTVICNGSGGSITAASISGTAQMTHAGTGTLTLGTATVSSAETALTFTRSNSGSFTVSTTAFSANATLKTEKTGSASALPSLTEVTVNNCTLTGDASTGFTAGKLTVSGSSAELAGLMTVTGNLTATASVLSVAGTLRVDGTLTANADTTVASSGALTAGSVAITGGNHTISGTVTAGTFSATGLGGKSLTVGGTLKVGSGVSAANAEETLKLSGTSASSKLTVSGSGTIRLNASQSGGTYLTVSTTGPVITDLSGTADEVIYTATFSSPSSGAATEFNGWNICSGGLVFIWKGGTGTTDTSRTSWNEPRNWTVRIVPRSTSVVDIPSSASYDAVIPSSSSVSITTLTVGSGRTLTLNAGLTVSGELTNNGTIDMNNNSLSFGSYADNTADGLIKLGAGSFNPGSGGPLGNIEFTATRSFGNISGLSIKNGTVDAGVALTITSGGLSFTGTLLNKGFITQNGNLSVNGALTNNGTIDMQNNSLSCGSYTDDGNNRWIKLGTGTFNPGSGGMLNNIEFTATRDFQNFTTLTITNGTVDSGVALTVTAGGLSFAGTLTNNGTITQNGNLSVTSTLANTGTISLQSGDLTVGGALDNNGTVNIGAQALQFAKYQHTANTLTDALTIAGGSITASAGGNGTGMISVSSLTMNGNTTVTNNGLGALKFAAATVNANVLLTSGGSGSAPVYSTLTISGSNTLTLASDLTAGTVNIGSSATLNADNRGKNADPNFAGYVLTVTGDFINNNSTPAETDDVVYRGFIPQSGKVVFTGTNGTNGTNHHIKGNIKFNDFYCHEAGAKLYFDVGTTINVDHQIDVEGAAGQLIEMTTVSAVEGEKWTLDVIWDVAAGTPQHPKPKIKYVAPHKSISYSAILKGCLDNCVDDVTELLDSTNVNWFNDMPTILMTMAPVGGRQLFVLFSTEVSAAPGCDLRTALTLAAPGGSSIIDTSVPLTRYTGTTDKSKTAYIFGLTRDLTWGDLYGSDCLHVEIAQTSAVRVGTTRISYQQGVKHATSDFAVNAARMLFGYDNYIDSSNPLTPEKGTNSVRTWDNTDYISNRLHSDSDLLFQAQFDASVPEDMRLEMVAQYASELNTSIIGDNYRDYYDLSTRLWLPEPDNFLPLSTVAQTLDASQKIAQDNTSSGRIRNFSLHYSKSSSVPLFQMKDGEEIQFLFKVKNPDGTDLLIDHDYDEGNGIYTPSARHPVYAIRLADDSDITSFDLWSVALQSTTLQRGNVTILNNVINADQKEQTFVTIQTQKAGSLTVQVLTLDGAVITTLERGRKQAGTWGYSWDGTNGKGKPVARGMYFIRVIGPDIDETRKVMVVRD